MFRPILLVAFSLWLCAQPAAAAIYEYKYTGQPLVLDDTPLPKDPPPLVLGALSGTLWIDEAKVPGGTLANTVLRHDCYYLDICPDADWLIRDTVFASVRSYHLLELGFDEQKRIVNWISSETDGFPDTFSTASGDGINSWDGYYSYSAPAGSWSDPKVVPLPASVLLLISALGGLGLMRPLFTSSSSERRVGANPPLGWRTRIAPDTSRAYPATMTPKLSKAVEAIEKLPLPRQDELADLLLDAAARATIDDSIAAGEASFAEHGGKPAAEVFERLIAKYGA